MKSWLTIIYGENFKKLDFQKFWPFFGYFFGLNGLQQTFNLHHVSLYPICYHITQGDVSHKPFQNGTHQLIENKPINDDCRHTFWFWAETYDSLELRFTYFGTPCREVWWQSLIEANQHYFHYEDAIEETNGGLLVYFCLKSSKIVFVAASTHFKAHYLTFFVSIL